MPEAILEPELPIVDPHHHLWDLRSMPPAEEDAHPFRKVIDKRQKYFLEELLADTGSGHNVRATVFIECGAMYRADGPEALRCVGETEFVNGVAAMSASGLYGETRACAGIVGRADFTMGDAVTGVLEAHVAAGGGRFRGVRQSASQDADERVLGPLSHRVAGLYASDAFRSGFGRLAPMGLSFDAWLLEPQLPDLVSLARQFPDTTIILDHVGTPLGLGSYEGTQQARFAGWREQIQALAKSPKVVVKLGGLAMAFCNFPSFQAAMRDGTPASSEQLAAEWRPYVETCIDAFGPERCMFESNFPVDMGPCDYATLWNTFKRLAAGYSASEKAALFSGTATKVYRLAPAST